jgi:8-oxo-dGTP pyrophosphatase MutT (NUDIX family)
MIWLKLFDAFKTETVNKLSGIAVIVDGHILLVLPDKFKHSRVKWSLPKGHVEGRNSLTSALKELREEAGIRLDRHYDYKFTVHYIKNRIDKEMEVFVYNRSREDFSKYLNPNTLVLKNKTIQSVLGDEEIYNIKFFPLDKAKKRMENIQRQVIDNLIHEDELNDDESNDINPEGFD